MRGEAFYVTSQPRFIPLLFFNIHISPIYLLFFIYFFFFTDDTLGLGFEAMVQALLSGQCIMNLIILL